MSTVRRGSGALARGVRWATFLGLALILGGCQGGGRTASAEDPARRILDGAQRAVGAGGAPSVLQVMTSARVEGPDGSFRTRVHSSSDGRARMEQIPQGFLAGVGASGPWSVDPVSGGVASPGPALTFVRGHELHMLALRPRSRLGDPRALGTAPFLGRPALAVAMSLPDGDSLVAYFDPADTLPLGVRVTWTDPPVDVDWSGWTAGDGLRLFERARFRQGGQEFLYAFDTIRVGPLPDSMFEPPTGPEGR